jgi:hypothetical protein
MGQCCALIGVFACANLTQPSKLSLKFDHDAKALRKTDPMTNQLSPHQSSFASGYLRALLVSPSTRHSSVLFYTISEDRWPKAMYVSNLRFSLVIHPQIMLGSVSLTDRIPVHVT